MQKSQTVMAPNLAPFAAILADKPKVSSAAWLQRLGDHGYAHFTQFGLPQQGFEGWKFTPSRPFTQRIFHPASVVKIDPNAPILQDFLDLDAIRITLVNGLLMPELSDLDALPNGLTIRPLFAQDHQDNLVLQNRVGSLIDLDRTPMSALGQIKPDAGLYIHVAPDVTITKPLYLRMVAMGADHDIIIQPRHLVHLEQGARLDLVQTTLGQPAQGCSYTNQASEIFVDHAAKFGLYLDQREAPTSLQTSAWEFAVAEAGSVEGFSLALGGALVRQDLHAKLDGRHINFQFDGLYHGRDKQLLDHSMFIAHHQPDSTSSLTFKGVLDGHAKGVFQAKTLVAKGADKTDGQQLNRALLLSSTAEIDVKPELEIYADDVKCAHGAASGDLDEDQLFYLMARGFSPRQAREMLIRAFLHDRLDAIPHEAVRMAFTTQLNHHITERA